MEDRMFWKRQLLTYELDLMGIHTNVHND